MTAQPFIHIQATDEQNRAFAELAACVQDRHRIQQDPHKTLLLAADVIAANSSNYTAWWVRRRALEHLSGDDVPLLNEIKGFTSTWLSEAPKSYQGWYHREWLIKRIQKLPPNLLQEELQDLCGHLDEDSKNHCAWQYRQAIVKHFRLPLEPEYEYIENLILSDCRNNSAWNYRQWLCSLSDPELQADIRKRETKFVATWIRRTPTNEALFHYLLGMFRDPISKLPATLPSLSTIHPSAREVIFELATGDEPSAFVCEMKALILIAEGKPEEARGLYQSLLETVDPLHGRYHEWLAMNC